MINLNSSQLEAQNLCDRINEKIDAAILERRKMEPVRKYLGASQIGEECHRKLFYTYAHTPVDPGRELTARALRIFQTGHAAEDAAALALGATDVPQTDIFRDTAVRWLVDAGFQLVTRTSDGRQLGFTSLGGRFGGHVDGMITATPLPNEIPTPCGWEHKGLNLKNWTKMKRHGVRKASPLYFGQMQIYMGYMEWTAFLFTCTNKNTQEMYHELVHYDPKEAQMLSDKALLVIKSVEQNLILPRCTDNPDFFICQFCDWKERCWHKDV